MNNDQNQIIETLKGYLTDYVNTITAHDPKLRDKYQCPLCGSGTHGNGTGAFSITEDGKHWHCFSCRENGDIFDLIGKMENITDYNEKVKRVASLYNVTGIDFTNNKQIYSNNAKSPKIDQNEPLKENPKDWYKEYIEQCAKDISQTQYFKNRGLPEEAQRYFNLGYDVKKYCVVIPYGKDNNYYIYRPTGKKQYLKPKSEWNVSLEVREPVYNKEALEDLQTPCFVCESPIDAMSIMYASNYEYNAVAVGGTGTNKLARYLKAHDLKPMLILNFDNDKVGNDATTNAQNQLSKIDVPFITATYNYEVYKASNKPTKDANDLLQANLSQFKSDIEANAQLLLNKVKTAQEERLEAHNSINGSNLLNKFMTSLAEGKGYNPISTGFEMLDKQLDGGLYPGLYVVGSLSSMGKTSYVLQLADQIAQQGKDVLYFSLEMGANELMARSISRITYLKTKPYTNKAKTTFGILSPAKYKKYNKEEKELIYNSMQTYKEYAKNIYIYEGLGTIGISDVENEIKQHKQLTGKTPVVFIDYLQILAPAEAKGTDKQNIDIAVSKLKIISRDYNTPVVAISSFNRDNYTTKLNMGAFKESGAIEYSCDVALGIQAQNMKWGFTAEEKTANTQNVSQTKKMDLRPIEVVILKNRNGRTEGRLGYNYFASFNYFEEDKKYKSNDDDIKCNSGITKDVLDLIK